MPRPDPNAPPESLVVNRFDGLKNTVQRERMGPRDLVRATNIDLDDEGQAHRRRGFTQKISGDCHSLFTTTQGAVLGVVDGALSVIRPDYSTGTLRRGVAGPLAFAQVGTNVYFSGRVDRGVVDLAALTTGPWGSSTDLWLSPVVNPTATLPAIAGRLLKAPPSATVLCYYNGRIYLAQGPVLWATELFSYHFVDATAGHKMFEADITMIGAVGDGIYVGTDEGLWFLDGPNYATMKRRSVMDSPVIRGSMVTIPAELGNPPQVPPGSDTPMQVALMFMTSTGACVASSSGQAVNITESKFFFPAAQSAPAMFRRQDGQNQYVAALQPGGTPQSNAAIGDFVDATIIRGAARGAWPLVADTLTLCDSPSYACIPA